jgi:hypothetical protein
MSKRETATRKATMKAVDSAHNRRVKRNAHATMKVENIAATKVFAKKSGIPVKRITWDTKIW